MSSPESSMSMANAPRLAPLPCPPEKMERLSKKDIAHLRRKYLDETDEEYFRRVNEEGEKYLAEREYEKRNYLDKYIDRHLIEEEFAPHKRNPLVDPEVLEKMDKYRKSVEKSGGFDVEYFEIDPRKYELLCGAPLLPISPMCTSGIMHVKNHPQLIDGSVRALHVYNRREGTRYMLHEVVKANHGARGSWVAGSNYYITFLAKEDPDKTLKPFEAKVYAPPTRDQQPIEVLLVRLKP